MLPVFKQLPKTHVSIYPVVLTGQPDPVFAGDLNIPLPLYKKIIELAFMKLIFKKKSSTEQVDLF